MKRRLTLGEVKWPDTPDFASVAKNWNANYSSIMLGFVWGGFDLLKREVLAGIDWSLAEDDLERSITQYLEPRIRQVMTGLEPFYIQHGPPEYETRKPAPARPPTYDLAFILTDNPRIMWPLEAKILATDGSVSPYVDEVANKFLTCRYAPFSREAAMLGYLLTGGPGAAFSRIARSGNWKLTHHSDFPNREHKVSDHRRAVPKGKAYPCGFRCHHLLFALATFTAKS